MAKGYERHGRVQQLLNRLNADALKFCEASYAALVAVMAGRRAPLRPPPSLLQAFHLRQKSKTGCAPRCGGWRGKRRRD